MFLVNCINESIVHVNESEFPSELFSIEILSPLHINESDTLNCMFGLKTSILESEIESVQPKVSVTSKKGVKLPTEVYS